MCLKLKSVLIVVSLLGFADIAAAQYPWPYHTDRKWYNHYEVDPAHRAGFRAGDEVWYPYRTVGQLQGSPYEGQTNWKDGGRGQYERVWRVHHIETTRKSIWITKTSLGTVSILYQTPTAPELFSEAEATIEDGVSIRSIKWIGNAPDWSEELMHQIVDKDSRPQLPHWARAEKVGWHSGKGYDYFGDNGDGTVNRYSRQSGVPTGGYQAMDNSRWTPYLPNGGAAYGDTSSSRSGRHRVSHFWETRYTGKPETRLATVYKVNGSWSISYDKAVSTNGGYPATITEVKGAIKSVRFHNGEPFPGASGQLISAFAPAW